MNTNSKIKKYIPVILIIPIVIIRGFTTIYPIIITFINSLYNIKVLSGIHEFIGFKNYIDVFKDDKIISSIKFTAIFVIVSMLFHVLLGTVLALILNMKFRGRRFLRTIVLIPWAMPAVVIGMAAKWGFNNDYGLINDLIRRFIPGVQLANKYRFCSWSSYIYGFVERLTFFCNTNFIRTSIYIRGCI